MLNSSIFLTLSKNMASGEKKKIGSIGQVQFPLLLIPSFQALEKNRANPSQNHIS